MSKTKYMCEKHFTELINLLYSYKMKFFIFLIFVPIVDVIAFISIDLYNLNCLYVNV